MTDAGRNSDLSAGELKALKFHHFNAIMAQRSRLAEQQEEYKRLRKLAKADRIILSDIDFMMKCADVEDDGILTDEIKRRAEIARWFALPISFQSDMFSDVAAEPLDDRAAREGQAVGYRGGERTSPYDVTSTAGQAWIKAFDDGAKQRIEDLASALEKVGGHGDDDELIKGSDPFDTELEAAE